MRTVTAFIEFDPETRLFVGTVPGIPGAHTQGATLDELQRNLQEVFGADRLISAMTARIIHTFHPLRIILFGSHARGDASLGSDVDLLVVLPEIADKRKAAIEIRRALADFPVSKDVIVTTPEEIARRGDLIGPVLRPALREGKLLYEQH